VIAVSLPFLAGWMTNQLQDAVTGLLAVL
jgi:hypothetical protein